MHKVRGNSPATGALAPGFSLLEILVVLAIAALVTGIVVLRAMGDQPEAAIRAELDRVEALLAAQCDRALFQGRSLGLRLTGSGLDYWIFADDGWQLLRGDRILRPRPWPEAIELRAEVDQRPVNLNRAGPRPQILCDPMGELTPFTLTLRSHRHTGTLHATSRGRIQRH